MIVPVVPPFAALLPSLDTCSDVRAAARAVPASAFAVATAIDCLARDLLPVHKAILTPSPRAFRLSLSQLLPALDLKLFQTSFDEV